MSVRAAVGAALALALLALSCGRRQPPDIVLILVDTLRADALSCYGQELPASPAVDALARRGLLYEEVQTVSPWTKPTVATLLTGLLPRQHGVRKGLRRDADAGGRVDVLPDVLPALPERLRAQGYTTVALQANPHCDARSGFGRGFTEYRERPFASAPALAREAVALLGEPRRGPLFLFVHLLDPHTDYVPRLAPFAPPGGLRKVTLDDLRGRDGDPAVVAAARLTYLSEVFEASQAIGTIAAASRRRPAAIVVTSDHGEEFLEHGGLEHGHSFFEELLRVPLVMTSPGGRVGIVAGRRSLLGVHDLLVRLPRAAAELPEGGLVASEAVLYGTDGYAVTAGPRKLVVRDGEADRSYDLGRDPGESAPLPVPPPSLEAPRAAFLALAPAAQGAGRRIDPEEEARLRSLGYAGGDAGAPPPPPADEAPAPADR